MRYRLLGRSGLRVSEAWLGTMTFGEEWGWGAPEATSARMLDMYLDAGGNVIDTADVYTNGTSEEMLGRLIGERRERLVLSTKYSMTVRPDDPNGGGSHRRRMIEALETSLRRLRTDRIDLLWVHFRDELTPVEETMRALDDQVRLGKVLYAGISDSPAWLVSQANTLADLRGWSPFVAVQLPYNVADRDAEREVLPMAAALGLAVTPWGILGAGVLTGKPVEERRWPEDGVSERTQGLVAVLQEVAADHGCTAAQAAIAWLVARPAPPPVLPILGARTEAQAAENLAGLDVRLDADALARLDDAGRPKLGFPRDFLESGGVRELIYGETAERLVSV